MSKDDQRRRLAHQVLNEQMSVSQAARLAGVSRQTAHQWVTRARQEGIATLVERSRRPHTSPEATETVAPEVVQQVRALKAKHEHWGATKIHRILWPTPEEAPICPRTVHRIFLRHGMIAAPKSRPQPQPLGKEPCRFEREHCNELWQIDYKGVERSCPRPSGYPSHPLSLLDDHSRFCLALSPAPSKTGESAWEILWQAFGEFGLPECLLCDNGDGDGFNNTRSHGPTWLQARLWRLGIRTTHGRPRHPQTQGKVERFHRTLELEVGADRLREARALETFRQSYNWVRPHAALGLRVPGSVYEASGRPRPARLPAHEWETGAIVRKVDAYGKISFRGQEYRPGRGLSGEWIVLREEEVEEEVRKQVEEAGGSSHVSSGNSGWGAYYAGVRIADLTTLRVWNS